MEWISVKDKLPETGITIIVGWPDHSGLAYLHSDGLFYPAHPAPYELPVTHWMPLPEPPKP